MTGRRLAEGCSSRVGPVNLVNTILVHQVRVHTCAMTFENGNPPSLAKDHTFHPALLPGYSRRRVRDADYPGITEEEGHVVRGVFATGLTEANLYRLDYFEGSEYERRKVKVKLLDQAPDGSMGAEGQEVDAHVYIFKDPSHLETREWDFDEFRREKLRYWSRAEVAFDGQSDLPLSSSNSQQPKLAPDLSCGCLLPKLTITCRL